jgi:hypothetical protein
VHAADQADLVGQAFLASEGLVVGEGCEAREVSQGLWDAVDDPGVPVDLVDRPIFVASSAIFGAYAG